MAIDARCPFCDKTYRLKDDLVGKKVTCANQDCRKVFPVAAVKVAPQDADAIAAAALSDEIAPVVPVENRTIAMSCVICEHKWTEPWDRQGKNVLCPDCKHRQKVPEQKQAKAADWRTGGGGPSLAKRETLEGVTSARDTAMVSGETLKATGIIDDGIEPVPLKVWLLRGAGVAAILFAIGLGVMFWLQGKRDKGASQVIDDFVGAADSEDFSSLPLHRGLLRMAGGEYEARRNEKEALPRAVELYSKSLEQLSDAPRSGDRDCLLAELALSILHLGGDGELVMDQKKLSWMPQSAKPGRGALRNNSAEEGGVRRQLERVLQAMKAKGAEFDVRAWTVRRLVRDLAARGQMDVLIGSVEAGFNSGELPEVRGQIGLELLRAGQADAAKAMADELSKELSATPPTGLTPVSAQALWQHFDIKGPTLAPPPTGPMTEVTRQAYTIQALAKKDSATALDIASKPGKANDRLLALSMGAECAEPPAPFLDAADKLVTDFTAKPEPNTSLSAFPLLRLTIAAAQTGDVEKAGKFAQAIGDAPLRAYAQAEMLRHTLKRDRSKTAAETDAPLPAEVTPKEFFVGFAWGRYQLARHNGFNDRTELARTYWTSWPKPLVAPFGAAGAMLGVQDRAVAP